MSHLDIFCAKREINSDLTRDLTQTKIGLFQRIYNHYV